MRIPGSNRPSNTIPSDSTCTAITLYSRWYAQDAGRQAHGEDEADTIHQKAPTFTHFAFVLK